MSHVLALDEGTSSCRSMIISDDVEIVAVEQQEFEQIFPKPGWVEHNAQTIWQAQLDTARDALKKAGLSGRDITCIGITNQRETVVLWDRATGDPIANAIVWQDRRTAKTIDQLKADGHEPMVQSKTGLVLDPYFSATKVKWLLDHVPGAQDAANAGSLAMGTIESWLIYKLTGHQVHVTDVSNACRTLLMNIRTGSWDDELLELFGVPRSILPKIVPSSGVCGETDPSLFGSSIPISGIGGDQQSALFGQLCTEKGECKNTFGTGCFLLTPTGNTPVDSANGLLTTIAWQMEGQEIQYALEGSIFMGGASIQWLRDGLGIIKKAPDVNMMAEQVEDNGGVWLVPAFAGLGAPHWDHSARGTILGLTRGSTAAHICRATLEGIAHQVADVAEAMLGDAKCDLGVLRVDGGAAQSNLLMQIQADLLGKPVERPVHVETTGLGAAFLAGLATGVWKDISEIKAHYSIERIFEPKMDEATRQSQRAQWLRAVERAKNWATD